MILKEQIGEIGKFNKPHGISGEIAATFDCDLDDVKSLSCIIVDMEGIFVPFYIKGVRPKSAATLLLKIDDVDSEEAVKAFVGKSIYALRNEIEIEDEDDDLRAFIGYSIEEITHGEVGKIVDIDDSTENVLFIVENSDGDEVLIPIADEFVVDIDDDNERIVMSLPSGIIDL